MLSNKFDTSEQCVLLYLNDLNFFSIFIQSFSRQNGHTRSICGVTIMRAGESLEKSLRAVIKECKVGKVLIQTNDRTNEPELYYLRLPKNMSQYKILLMDATVATGTCGLGSIE